jgi:hypothetical protein
MLFNVCKKNKLKLPVKIFVIYIYFITIYVKCVTVLIGS